MAEATFTFRVDENLKTDFVAAAKACDRTGAQLLRDFMRSYVRQETSAAPSSDEVLASKVQK